MVRVVTWAYLTQPPKWHLDHFSRFCRAYKHDQQRERHTQTDHALHV